MIKNILIILCLISLCPSYGGTIDPANKDIQYLEYGKEFNCIGKLCGSYKDGSKFCASAVAIDNHHILTAAHVVKDSNSCVVHFNDKEFCLTNVTMHKDFDTKFGIGDIAIGYSKEPFNLEKYPELYVDTDEKGKTCSISGYGLTGTFITGSLKSDQKRRAGLNIIDNIYEDMLICNPSSANDKTKTNLEFMIASGDSGGGLFINGRLAGINSCVMAVDKSPRSRYNEESGHTRIQKFIPWIKANKVKKDE